jgi:phytanoyl-CoA hydroxylase
MMPFDEKVAKTVSSLICDDREKESVCCYLSQVFWKPPKIGLGTGWHQDNAYFELSPEGARHGTAMWTAIHDATIENGTIRVDSEFRDDVLNHRRDLTSDHHITCADSINDADSIPIELKAGGVLFFAFNTPHCTRTNDSSNSRAAVAYHFLNTKYYRDRAFPLPEDTEWKTPIISGPDCTGGIAEYSG